MAFGEDWSVYEERESGCYRKLRECETGLLIRKCHCEMFLKHYTCVLKCFKTLYHKQRWLSSGQSHLIPDPLPRLLPSLASTGSLARGLPLQTPSQQPWMKGTFHPDCAASPHPTWWRESQARWHQWVRQPEARAEDSPDSRSLGNNCHWDFHLSFFFPRVMSLELGVGSFQEYSGL